jgi:cbb3-type cytochrome oxidase subunit 3
MIRELLSHAHIGLPLFGMGLFMVVFVAIVARTFGRNAASYSAEERMPLEDESDHLSTRTRTAPHGMDGGRRG